MLLDSIPHINNKLFLIPEQLKQISDKYKNFSNFKSIKEVNDYLDHLSYIGELVIVDIEKNILYNTLESGIIDDYSKYFEFSRISDLESIFELISLHKTILFIDVDWIYDILGGCKLVCRFGIDFWKSYTIHLL